MNPTTENESLYWFSYIEREFEKNNDLYVEFDIDRNSRVYLETDVTFKDGYKLKAIGKAVLLQYIQTYIQNNFGKVQYVVTTRAKNNSYGHYIVVSIIQENVPLQIN